jgi:hypothetical protein
LAFTPDIRFEGCEHGQHAEECATRGGSGVDALLKYPKNTLGERVEIMSKPAVNSELERSSRA